MNSQTVSGIGLARAAGRAAVRFAIAASALATGLLIAEPAASRELRRKPGLWEIQMTVDASYRVPTSQICLDRAASSRMTIVGAQMDRAFCAQYRLDGSPPTWTMTSACRLDTNGATVETTGTITGSLKAAYRVHAEGRVSGSKVDRQNGIHQVDIEARRLGLCPAGQRGGDVTSAGNTYNVFAPAAPKAETTDKSGRPH